MRRTPLKRKSTLKRKTPIRSRGNTSYRRRKRDVEYMLLVKKLPCVIRGMYEAMVSLFIQDVPKVNNAGFRQFTLCDGRVEADHMGQRAFGKKADDRTCVPMCRKHHRERTDMRGAFASFSKHDMRLFCDLAVAHTQLEIAALEAGRGEAGVRP